MIKVEPLLLRIAPALGNPLPVAQPVPVGSVVAVEAVRDSATGQMLLQFAGRRWALKPGGAAAELQPGQRVMARVVRAEPDLELACLGRAQEVAAAMRRELPRQASPLRLLANLEWFAASPAAAAKLPAPVRAALEAAWRSVPESRQLTTGDGLARAVNESGVRLESLLATGSAQDAQAALPVDWKAALVRLHEVLGQAGAPTTPRPELDRAPLPSRHGTLSAVPREHATLAQAGDTPTMLGELSQQTREALARVTCTQLASLDGHDGLAYPLLVEIPYRSPDGTDLLRLRIDREAPAPHATGSVWSIEFAFDLGLYGPLRGRATLAEGRVSVTLQPESGTLAQLLDAHCDDLRATLEQAGVPVGKLTCTRTDLFDPGRTGSWLVNLHA